MNEKENNYVDKVFEKAVQVAQGISKIDQSSGQYINSADRIKKYYMYQFYK